jgi:CubicO group peptidase (beta-lactamase class C family)
MPFSLFRCFLALGICVSVFLGQQSEEKNTPGKPQEEIGTFRQLLDGTLYPGLQVSTLRNMARLSPSRTVKHGTLVYPLPSSDIPLKKIEFTSAGKKYDLYDYLSLNRVTGLLILKNGKISLEHYELGNTESTRWYAASLTKSVVSTLVGAALKDGYIKSLDDPVTKYLPQLAGSSYDGVTVRNLIQMASGVKWDDSFTNPASDRSRMVDAQLAGKPGSILEIMRTLPRAGPPGTIWNYSQGEAQIVSELIRAAVKRPVSEYMSERIWSKFGMESDASWWLDSPDGQEIGGGGFNATLRDYGRFGLFFMNGGVAGGEKVLPDDWVAEAGTSKVIGGKKVDYGYMWWTPPTSSDVVHQRAFFAVGVFGQLIYINPRENLTAVILSARPKPMGMDTIRDEDFLAAVVKALR